MKACRRHDPEQHGRQPDSQTKRVLAHARGLQIRRKNFVQTVPTESLAGKEIVA
jgi:hypothetical protein